MKCCVCYCVDNDIKSNKMLLCSLYSLRKHNKDLDVKIFTFLSNKFIKYFQEYNVNIIDCEEIYNKKYKNIKQMIYDQNNNIVYRPDISNMSYFRLELPLVLNDYDKVLYLDTDTEIKKSLTDIFNLQFEGYEVLGQTNVGDHLDECIKVVRDNNFVELGDYVYRKTDFICAGVILFNIHLLNMRDYKTYLNNILEFEYKNYQLHEWKDEFLINASMHCKACKLLDPTCFQEYSDINYNGPDAYIVHYLWIYKDILLQKYDFLLKDIDIE